MLVSAAVLAGVVVPFPSFAEYFGPVSRIPAVGGHWINQAPKSSSGPAAFQPQRSFSVRHSVRFLLFDLAKGRARIFFFGAKGVSSNFFWWAEGASSFFIKRGFGLFFEAKKC